MTMPLNICRTSDQSTPNALLRCQHEALLVCQVKVVCLWKYKLWCHCLIGPLPLLLNEAPSRRMMQEVVRRSAAQYTTAQSMLHSCSRHALSWILCHLQTFYVVQANHCPTLRHDIVFCSTLRVTASNESCDTRGKRRFDVDARNECMLMFYMTRKTMTCLASQSFVFS